MFHSFPQPEGHQLGVSILNSLFLSDTFCLLTRVRNITQPWDFGINYYSTTYLFLEFMYWMVYVSILLLRYMPQLKTKIENGKNFCENYLFAFFFFCGGGSTGRFSFPLETVPAWGPWVCLTCLIICLLFFFFRGGGSTGRFSFPSETVPARCPRVCLTCEK